MAIKSIPLIEVCNGSINKDISFTHFDGRNEIPVWNLSFKIKFQEIWDFKVSLLDWQIDDIKDRERANEPISSLLKVSLTNGK